MIRAFISALLFLLTPALALAADGIYEQDPTSGSRYFYVLPDIRNVGNSNADITLSGNGVGATGNFRSAGFGGGHFYGKLIREGVPLATPNTGTALFGGSGAIECYGQVTSIFYPFIAYKCAGTTGSFMFTALVTSKLIVPPTPADISINTLGASTAIKNALLSYNISGADADNYYAGIGSSWAIHRIQGNTVELELPRHYDSASGAWKNIVVTLVGFLPTLAQKAQDKVSIDISQTNVCVDTTDSDYWHCGGKATKAPW